MPTLLRRETWRSHVSALASIHLFETLVDDRTKGKVRDRDEIITALEKRIQDIVKLYIQSDPGKNDWKHPHHNETDSVAELEKNKGWPIFVKPKKRKKDPATPVDKLSIGYMRSPRALLEQLSVLHTLEDKPPTESRDS